MVMKHQEEVRYSRQIILPEIAKKGQERLLNSKVLVIGAGGLGCANLPYLASSGVGEIGIVDFDKVELNNLQRQVLHENSDVGQNKVESAKQALEDLNPEIKITAFDEKLEENNAESLIKNYDLIIDGTDNYSTRFLINDICVKLQKPLVTAAILKFEGQVMAFKNDAKSPCYRCIYPELPPEGTMPSCSLNGIFAPVAGVAGNLQAALALKILLGIEEDIYNQITIFNLKNWEFRKVKLRKDIDCKICSNNKVMPFL